MGKIIKKIFSNYRKVLSVIVTFSLLLPNFLAPISVIPVFAASTECVGSGTGCYANLQDAINAVDVGGTINIESGTFSPTSTINVNKSVTIRGAGRDLTTINASGYSGYGMHITANNVTLRDFTFTGAKHYGFKIAGNSNITLSNLRVSNSAKTNIDFNGTDNVVISNVISTGAIAGNGLSITDSENYTISNFTSSGNLWGGIALYTSTYYPPAGVNNITLGTGISISDNPRMYSEVNNLVDHITNINYPSSLFRYVITNPLFPKFTWYAYESDYSSITSIPGNVVYDNILGYIVFPAPSAPTTVGINVKSLSTLPSETPVDLTCGASTNDNNPAQVWTPVSGTNIKYQRQAKLPSGAWWTDPIIYSGTNTNWLSFNGWDGVWKLRVRAFEDNNSNGILDSADSVSAWSNECIINYDDTKPSTPSILYPSEGSAFNTTPILNDWSDSTDLSGIAKYIIEYQYDDGHTFSGGPYRESIVSKRNHTPALFEEGGVKFRVSAIDNVGNQSDWSDWRHYFYDITETSSSFITPVNDSKYNVPIEISGVTTDNVGVDKVSIYYKNSGDTDDPSNWIKIADLFNTAKNTPYNWTYTWTPSTDGKYDLKVYGFDTAGNIENTGYAYNILYDTTDPVVDITSHTNGDVLKGNVNISGTVNDTNLWRYYFVVKNSSSVVVAGPGTVYDAGPVVNVSLNWNTTLVPDGTYTIRLEARDIANNKGADSVEVVTVVVDNSAPSTPKILNTPFVTHNGDLPYSGGSVRSEIKFLESSDLSGVKRYEYQFVRLDLNGNKLQQGLANMNTYLGGISCVSGVCSWKPDTQDNNQWVFRIRAVDVVDNVSAWSNWNNATDSEFYSFSTTYNQYLSNSGIFARSDYDGTGGNGSYAVRESIKPTSSITSPSGVFITNNPNLNIQYNSSDTGSDVKNVKLYSQAGDLLATSSSGEFNITLPSVDGSYCMYTRAEDVADDKVLDAGSGNIEDIDNDCELEVMLDVTAPTNPKSVSTSHESPSKSNVIYASLPQLDTLDGASDALSGVKGYSYIWSLNSIDVVDDVIDIDSSITNINSTALTDGEWYLHIRTVDNVLNWSDVSSFGPYVIDNTKPVITRNGTDVTIVQGQPYTDPGATAFDTQDGDISANIITVNPVNVNILGTYTVTYNVSDSAGNAANQVTRTVNVVPSPVVPAVAAVNDEEETVGEQNNNLDEEKGDVLGVCTVLTKVSGFIYLDKDNNGKKDSDESGVSDVEVIVYSKADNSEVTTVKTDSEGKWSVELCSGQYYVKLSNPKEVKGFKVSSDTIDFDVKDLSDIQDLNFVYENTSKFNWWWLLLLILVVVSAGGYIYLTRKRKEDE